jgi:hypothetical protein
MPNRVESIAVARIAQTLIDAVGVALVEGRAVGRSETPSSPDAGATAPIPARPRRVAVGLGVSIRVTGSIPPLIVGTRAGTSAETSVALAVVTFAAIIERPVGLDGPRASARSVAYAVLIGGVTTAVASRLRERVGSVGSSDHRDSTQHHQRESDVRHRILLISPRLATCGRSACRLSIGALSQAGINTPCKGIARYGRPIFKAIRRYAVSSRQGR